MDQVQVVIGQQKVLSFMVSKQFYAKVSKEFIEAI